LAVKEMGRNVAGRQKQARGLVWAEIEVFLSFEPRNLRDIRDRALVAVAYDTMCRREELVSLRVEDIAEARLRQDVATDEVREASRARAPDSPSSSEGRSPNCSTDGEYSGSVLIRRSKTDTTGEGATAYLSPLTMRLLKEWITQAGIREGAIFVRVHGSAGVGESLTAQNVATVFKKVGQWIGLGREQWEKLSGHSARVGAAQDLLALNIDVASVMQAGRWTDTRMPIRYGEKVLASRGGMARAAKQQGRA
jgi:integrase